MRLTQTERACDSATALFHMLLLVSYEGRGKVPGDIDGVVALPEAGHHSEGLMIKAPEVHELLQEYKREIERIDARSSRKIKAVVGRYYRQFLSTSWVEESGS